LAGTVKEPAPVVVRISRHWPPLMLENPEPHEVASTEAGKEIKYASTGRSARKKTVPFSNSNLLAIAVS
jgi:hypothetical protein